jgi:hypothetical protein
MPAADIQSSACEIELTFLVNEVEFKAIQKSALLGAAEMTSRGESLHSIYFDTEAGDLRRNVLSYASAVRVTVRF